jgi:DNA-directed RNA polymerase subunit RPC12/RpoP
MKCSFCEAVLVCKHCGKPFQARKSESHVAVYQRDMEIACPECQKVLVCKACNFVYGDPDEPEEE